MKRYEYPPPIARITGGLGIIILVSWFFFSLPPELAYQWSVAWSLMVVLAGVIALRPASYIALSGNNLWFGKQVGRGHLSLPKVEKIVSNPRGGTTLLTRRQKVHMPALVTDYWDCLEKVVAACQNAEVDSLTRELLDKSSTLHKKVDRSMRSIHIAANIILPCVAVLAVFLLMQSIFRR